MRMKKTKKMKKVKKMKKRKKMNKMKSGQDGLLWLMCKDVKRNEVWRISG